MNGIDEKHCIPWVEFESNIFIILSSGGIKRRDGKINPRYQRGR
jgi:hypothetical protein